MKIHLILGQYHSSYPGEYAPNVMAAWDEYQIDSNPDGFQEDIAKYESWIPRDLESTGLLVINVPDDAIDRALNPVVEEVDATVEGE